MPRLGGSRPATPSSWRRSRGPEDLAGLVDDLFVEPVDTDTALSLEHASHDLQRGQASVADDIVVLISKPEAQDGNGPLTTSVSASGSTVTMRVQHGLGTAYPVIATQRVDIADGVYDYEALTAVASLRESSRGSVRGDRLVYEVRLRARQWP